MGHSASDARLKLHTADQQCQNANAAHSARSYIPLQIFYASCDSLLTVVVVGYKSYVNILWYHKHPDELLPIHQRPMARKKKKLHEYSG